MYGAILGDIIGSRFEFDRGGKTKDFDLYTNESCFTDDTAMTVAIADGLIKAGPEASVEEIKHSVIKSMQDWGHKYPYAGYGAKFIYWLDEKNPKPYGSWGNGSAMRVSAAGWLYNSLERTREVARATAEVSHNHPEGIKGAECTAAVMFLSRGHIDKEIIKLFVINEFGYNLSKSVDELRPLHEHVESCQDSLPKALVSFFEGDSYEDVIRNAVSLGGDTDTLGAIAGAMAEAYYGVPENLIDSGKNFIPKDMQKVIDTFTAIRERVDINHEEFPEYVDNAPIRAALTLLATEENEEERVKLFYQFLNFLAKRVSEEAEAPTPFVDVNNVIDTVEMLSHSEGDEFQFDQDLRLRMDTMTDSDGKLWLPLFTGNQELEKGEVANVIVNCPIETILRMGLSDDSVEGVVINPFGHSFTMTKDLLGKFLSDYDSWVENKEEN